MKSLAEELNKLKAEFLEDLRQGKTLKTQYSDPATSVISSFQHKAINVETTSGEAGFWFSGGKLDNCPANVESWFKGLSTMRSCGSLGKPPLGVVFVMLSYASVWILGISWVKSLRTPHIFLLLREDLVPLMGTILCLRRRWWDRLLRSLQRKEHSSHL
ncbi:hypothetical protein DV515_00007446 [Chloebia gouldiae]|uniref:Uncharacterized protein n=1 Tax=Chloebia gouldiae TaxID=44316 RepID=A0A3L8SIL9_CHLGU|nr:hypothetical protein DV515_00007446 [Chloebia gouldiae]